MTVRQSSKVGIRATGCRLAPFSRRAGICSWEFSKHLADGPGGERRLARHAGKDHGSGMRTKHALRLSLPRRNPGCLAAQIFGDAGPFPPRQGTNQPGFLIVYFEGDRLHGYYPNTAQAFSKDKVRAGLGRKTQEKRLGAGHWRGHFLISTFDVGRSTFDVRRGLNRQDAKGAMGSGGFGVFGLLNRRKQGERRGWRAGFWLRIGRSVAVGVKMGGWRILRFPGLLL